MDVKPGYKQTDVGVIPMDWTIKPLGEFAQFRNGLNFVKSDRGDIVKVVGVGDFQSHFRLFYDELDSVQIAGSVGDDDLLKDGDLLFVRSNGNKALIGRCVLIDGLFESVSFSGFTIRARVSRAVALPVYVGRFFQSEKARHQIKEAGEGSHISNLSQQVLASLKLSVPPLPEQEAIAGALGDADALIDALEQLVAKKRQIKLGAMQELLTGQKRLPGFATTESYTQTEVGRIPKDWIVRPLLSAVRIAQGQVDPKVAPYCNMCLVGPAHVQSGTGKLLGLQTAAEQRAISGKYLFEKGDIVYGKINPYLKKAFVAEFRGLCSADMYPLRPMKGISSGFILAVILGQRFTKYAESVSIRSGMPKINREEMAGFLFPAPESVEEQSAIATILSDMDAELAVIETKLVKARQIKQGMMQELLTGRIRLV